MMRIRRRRIIGNGNVRGVNGGGRLPHPVRRREISMVMTILRRRIGNGNVRGVNGGGRLPHPVRRREISTVMRILL